MTSIFVFKQKRYKNSKSKDVSIELDFKLQLLFFEQSYDGTLNKIIIMYNFEAFVQIAIINKNYDFQKLTGIKFKKIYS